jgi:hypothetical protein
LKGIFNLTTLEPELNKLKKEIHRTQEIIDTFLGPKIEKNSKTIQQPTNEELNEEILKRAEEIYKNRSAANKPGDALSDWLQAEKDIKKKYSL